MQDNAPPVPDTCKEVDSFCAVLQISVCSSLEPGKNRAGKVNELFVYDNFSRVPVENVQAGDICAVTGIQDIGVSKIFRRCCSGGVCAWALVHCSCRSTQVTAKQLRPVCVACGSLVAFQTLQAA
eukprot:GHRR01022853.1.p1 GENE.GHRR01022853.1~~GHRR01022853.1.p1  ORF type:complete len:125 (-),score=25.22 GHRR01022853.1:670-1044(-)